MRGRESRVVLAMLLVALLGALGAYGVISPAYQSSGMVRVLAREAKILYADSDDSRLRLYDAFVAAEMELLQSRPVLEAALADLHSREDSGFPLLTCTAARTAAFRCPATSVISPECSPQPVRKGLSG